MNLTQEDKKILKYEKRIGYALSMFIFALGGILSLYLYVEENWLFFKLISSGTVILSFLTSFLINRKINKDLKTGTKFVRIEQIMETKHEIDYEAGSAMPRPFWREMKAYSKYTLIINGIAYNIEKELFENVKEGDLIEIHEAIYSGVLLGFKKLKK